MAKDAKTNFEIPEEMRKFADQSVEQARKAFEAVISTAQQTVTTLEGRAAAAQAGAKDVGEKAMAFAEHNGPPAAGRLYEDATADACRPSGRTRPNRDQGGDEDLQTGRLNYSYTLVYCAAQ
jgi:hypothetical protein